MFITGFPMIISDRPTISRERKCLRLNSLDGEEGNVVDFVQGSGVCIVYCH